MRRAVLPLAALLVAGLCPALFAQGVFPLQYRDASGFAVPQLLVEDKLVYATDFKPGAPKPSPSAMRRFRIAIGGREVLFAFMTAEPSTLYVDTKGDLTKLETFPATREDAKFAFAEFGPISVAGASKGTELRVNVRAWEDRLTVRPAGYRSGVAKLDGRNVLVALGDGDLDGRYDTVFSPANAKDRVYDRLAVDLNGDGRFDFDFFSCEAQPLPKRVAVNGAWWSVKPAPDGSSIEFARADPPMGTLDTGDPQAELLLWSENGAQLLAGNGGRFRVAAGSYVAEQVRLTRTDRSGRWALATRDLGKLARLDVEPGRTLSAPTGLPLVAKTDLFRTTDAMQINFAIYGASGEKYSPALTLNGRPVEAPQLKITDAGGRLLESGRFVPG